MGIVYLSFELDSNSPSPRYSVKRAGGLSGTVNLSQVRQSHPALLFVLELAFLPQFLGHFGDFTLIAIGQPLENALNALQARLSGF